MTTVKLEGSVGGQAAEALSPHARTLYNKPGGRWFAVVELGHVERLQPAPDSEKEPSVKLRVTGLEFPTGGRQAEIVGRVMEALYLQRTAAGTLDESGEIQLHDSTLELAAGMLSDAELARLRVGMTQWARYVDQLTHKGDLTLHGARAELRKISAGLSKILGRDIEEDRSDAPDGGE